MAAHDRIPLSASTAALDAATRALSDGYMAGLSYSGAPARPAYRDEPETHAAIRQRTEQLSADRLAGLAECQAAFAEIRESLRSGDPASLQEALETADTFEGFASGFVEEALQRFRRQAETLPPGVLSLAIERERRSGRRA